MHSSENIANTIRDTVMDVAGIRGLEKDASLLDEGLGINPVDFLYIFNILEEKLQIPVHDIFMFHNYEVMNVRKLADAIYEHNRRNVHNSTEIGNVSTERLLIRDDQHHNSHKKEVTHEEVAEKFP